MPSSQDFVGAHSTALRWNSVNQQLHLKVEQVISTFRDLQVKYRADINTATGAHRHRCQILRPLTTNEPFFQDFLPLARYYEEKKEAHDSRRQVDSELIRTEDLEDNVNRILPGGLRALLLEDFSISPGISLCSGRDQLRYTVKLNKFPQYVKHFHRMDTFVELKARADIEPVTKEVTLKVAPRLSLFRRNVTQNQNIRATVGYDVTTDFTAAPTKGLYFSVTDSRWDLKFKQNRWQFTYAL